MITISALDRKESRGAQFRDDYPDKDAAFGKINVVASQQGCGRDSSGLETVSPFQMPDCPKQIVEEMK